MKRLLFYLVTLTVIGRVEATTWWASTNGSGDGSSGSPWSLTKALTNTAAVLPGDNIWLRGGMYGVGSNIYTCTLVGTSNAPITIRNYNNERAIINGGIYASAAKWTTFWGLEITCTNGRTNKYNMRPAGLEMDGIGDKAINLVLYDTGHPGIASFAADNNGREISGCVILRTGIWQVSDNGDIGAQYTTNSPWQRGSPMYLQGRSNTFLVYGNVTGSNYTSGGKAYTEGGYANGFTFDSNITFGNGDEGLEVESLDNVITNAIVINNLTYRSVKTPMGFYNFDSYAQHGSLLYSNNYHVDNAGYRESTLWLKRWRTMTVVANTIVTVSQSNDWFRGTGTSTDGGSFFIDLYPATNILSNVINWNTYRGGVMNSQTFLNPGSTNFHIYAPFRYYGTYDNELGWYQWTNAPYSFDLNSSYSTNLPSANVVVIHTNRYEQGRANVAIVNWATNSTYNVDLSNVGLTNGQYFHARNVDDYFGTPPVAAYYAGASVAFPLSASKVMNTFVVEPATAPAESYINTLNIGTLNLR